MMIIKVICDQESHQEVNVLNKYKVHNYIYRELLAIRQ